MQTRPSVNQAYPAPAWPHAELTAWLVSVRSATIVALVPLFGLLGVALLRDVNERLLLDITAEDGLLEWSQFAAFVVAAAFSAAAAVNFHRADRHLLALAYAGLALAAVFVAGEEISWGQRLLGYHAPEPFASHNAQDELNAHNLDLAYIPPFGRLQLLAGGYGSLATLVFHSIPRGARRLEWEYLAPPLFLVPAFACVAAVGLGRVVHDFDPTGTTYNEWAEFSLGFGVAVFAVLVRRRLKSRRNGFR